MCMNKSSAVSVCIEADLRRMNVVVAVQNERPSTTFFCYLMVFKNDLKR